MAISCWRRLYNYPYAYTGGISVYGVADWVDFLQRTAPERRANREGVYGSLEHDRAFLASISPINHVADIKRPVLIIGGANDTIVPIAQSERMAMALRRDGVPMELHVFPNEGHGISHVENLVAIYRWTIAFMQCYAGKPERRRLRQGRNASDGPARRRNAPNGAQA